MANGGMKDVVGRAIDDSKELTLKVKLLNPNATMPTRGSEEAAGFDLYATEDFCIGSQSSVQVPLGVAVEIPKGYVGLLFARSGIATKKHLRPSNCVGVIDSDYRGEVMINLYNDSFNAFGGALGIGTAQTIHQGERIAQLVILPYISPRLIEVESLSDTDRGEGGFGSTDEKK